MVITKEVPVHFTRGMGHWGDLGMRVPIMTEISKFGLVTTGLLLSIKKLNKNIKIFVDKKFYCGIIRVLLKYT